MRGLFRPFEIMKFRRHHNNKGYRQIKSGKLHRQIKILSKKMRIEKKDNQ